MPMTQSCRCRCVFTRSTQPQMVYYDVQYSCRVEQCDTVNHQSQRPLHVHSAWYSDVLSPETEPSICHPHMPEKRTSHQMCWECGHHVICRLQTNFLLLISPILPLPPSSSCLPPSLPLFSSCSSPSPSHVHYRASDYTVHADVSQAKKENFHKEGKITMLPIARPFGKAQSNKLQLMRGFFEKIRTYERGGASVWLPIEGQLRGAKIISGGGRQIVPLLPQKPARSKWPLAQ